jgi:dTDP-4-amino-4,6-dideoxygalactose transaminase
MHGQASAATAKLPTGTRPVLADINPYTYTISTPETKRAVTGRTRARLATHLFGQPGDMAALAGIAKRHNLVLIEVSCEAFDAWYGDTRTGSFGTAVYSFQQGMAIATGEGGLLTTHDAAVASTVQRLANSGCNCRERMLGMGFNYRMPGIIGALAQEQLPP